MGFVGSVINKVFDLFFYPFRSLDPVYGLCAVSLVTVGIVLPIFKYASDQQGIRSAKSRITGHLLEIWIYNNNLRVLLTAQKNVFKYNMLYLSYMFRPLLIAIVPVAIIFVHTDLRYKYRPFHSGEAGIVKLRLEKPSGPVDLIAPDGVRIETPPLRVNRGKEIYWRVRPVREGVFELRVKGLGGEVKKELVVSKEITRLSPRSTKGGLFHALFNPGGSELMNDSTIEYFEVRYPELDIGLLGWHTNWLVLFLVLTLVFSLILLKPFNVRI